MKRDIIILAKSDKHMGYCVAGIDRRTGEWIRVVSDNIRTEGAVPPEDMKTNEGKFIEIYDIIEIDFIRHMPKTAQPENYLYNNSVVWKKKGKSNLKEVLGIHGFDGVDYVFGNEKNKLEPNELYETEGSLLLLKVNNPVFFMKSFPERNLLQLNFDYNRASYSYFRITQRELKDQYAEKGEGCYQPSTDIFVFSLTDRYKDGKYYKVVAQALE